MATRKTTFEVVSLVDIAPLLKDAEVLGNAEETETKGTSARILCVTYDPSLAATRKMLFTSVGFQVTSASTIDQAIHLCGRQRFGLIVIGHSMPTESRRLLIRELRRRCGTPLLELRHPEEPALMGVDYTFDSTESPAHLLEEVIDILRPQSGARKSKSDD
jgi:DNA-binding response OmpR family regulator